MQKGLVIRKFKLKDWKKVKRLYKNSFSKNERYLFILLYFNILRKNSNMFLLEEKSKIVGFIHLIYYKNMVFILYLAIDKEKRRKGYGSTLLKYCNELYKDKVLYLNIEEVKSNFNDSDIRKKRLDFYLKNNFYITEYISYEQNLNFNILTSSKKFNIEEYIELDKRISHWYLDKKSKIKKINHISD